MTMRGAQIDPTLCVLTTLSLYGLLRHLLLGPAWGWYFVGGLAAGLGVITKGVGFLPLLVLLPYALLRARGFAARCRASRWRALGAARPVGFLLGVAVWLVPMLLARRATRRSGAVAYRDGILFQQTVERYASAWHHVKPWYYFLVEVIPAAVAARSACCSSGWCRDGRQPGASGTHASGCRWPGCCSPLLFFSLSAGKRGIYIFPALPACAARGGAISARAVSSAGVQRLEPGAGCGARGAGVRAASCGLRT